MLRAELVERALVRPLEHRPERLDALRVNVPVNVLADGVPNRLVILQAAARRRIVGVDLRSRLDVIGDEALDRLDIG